MSTILVQSFSKLCEIVCAKLKSKNWQHGSAQQKYLKRDSMKDLNIDIIEEKTIITPKFKSKQTHIYTKDRRVKEDWDEQICQFLKGFHTGKVFFISHFKFIYFLKCQYVLGKTRNGAHGKSISIVGLRKNLCLIKK